MGVTKMIPKEVSESVTLVKLPNYEEKFTVSVVDYEAMKRYNEGVNLAPCMTPVHFKDTIICFKDSTKKRYISNTYYEPRVKPRQFRDTMVIFPKQAGKTYVSCVDYHIDECRRWFKTSLEFRAKTYTTNKILNGEPEVNGLDNNTSIEENGPGASQVFMPRFFKDENDNMPTHMVNGIDGILVNGY